MERELSRLSREELWELFPIFLVKPDDKWAVYYEEIEAFLKTILHEHPVERISHIGSTAVAGIWANNIVDVLVELSRDSALEAAARVLERNGFLRMSSEPGRISLNRGYERDGFAEKVYHVHLRCAGDHDELYFRDYLNEHPQTAREYEALKLSLWKRFEHDRDGYTQAKTAFVEAWTAEAKRVCAGRY